MVNSKELRMDLAREAGLSTERFLETSLEASIAETALAKEIEKLSMEEHEKHLFELHGIGTITEENPKMIAQALSDLQEELDTMPEISKDAYEQAKFLNPSYVNDRKFLLMFLRCHEFDIATTAKTIAFHFEIKRKVFGNGEILARDVRQSDLSPKAIEILKAGWAQVLPERDASGRAVMIAMVDGYFECYGSDDTSEQDKKDATRSYWYSTMAVMQDEESQKYGVVSLCFHYRPMNLSRIDFDFLKHVNELDVAIPCRTGGWHYCYIAHNKEEQEQMRLFVKGMELFSKAQERLKMRSHEGTHEEIQFNLQTYGIPMKDCPIRKDGTYDTKFHLEWLNGLRAREEEEERERQLASNEMRRQNEFKVMASKSTATTAIAETTMIPTKCDVLFGKNARSRDHAGNMRAHDLVDEHFEAYEAADKTGKTQIANTIILSIRKSGGRFLKQSNEGGGWEEVADTVARQKIAHWCRHLRHKKNNTKSSEDKTTTTTTTTKTVDSTNAASANAASKRVTPPPQDRLDEEDDRFGKRAATTS